MTRIMMTAAKEPELIDVFTITVHDTDLKLDVET